MMSFAEPFRLIEVINPIGPYGNSTDDKVRGISRQTSGAHEFSRE